MTPWLNSTFNRKFAEYHIQKQRKSIAVDCMVLTRSLSAKPSFNDKILNMQKLIKQRTVQKLQ